MMKHRSSLTRTWLGGAVCAATALFSGSCLDNATAPAIWPTGEDIRPVYTFTFPEATATQKERRAPLEQALRVLELARSEIHVFCYGFDEPELVGALVEARRRGVGVQIVGSGDQDYAELIAAGFQPEVRLRSGLQHTKLIVADRSWLFTGTGNFTQSDLLRSHNAFVTLRVTADQADRILAPFLNEGLAVDEAPVLEHGIRLLPGPALGRGMQMLLLDAILEARHSIRYLIFSHTDPLVTAALALQASRGIAIEGIYDDPTESGELPDEPARWNARLGGAPVMLYLEGNRMGIWSGQLRSGGKLHHKTLIVDGQRVLTGSYNWSLSARDRNMELMLDIRDPAAAAEFEAEFDRIRSRASLIGRPPFPGPAPAVLRESGSLCTTAPARATFLGGSGTRMRWRELQLPGGCIEEDATTLLAETRGAPLMHDGGALLVDLSPTGREATDPHLDCSSADDCQSVAIVRAWPQDGTFVLPEHVLALSGGVRVTTRTGIQSAQAEPIDQGVYRVEPWQGDALLFFELSSGRTGVGCVRSGAALDSALESWLDVFVAFGGKRPVCAEVR